MVSERRNCTRMLREMGEPLCALSALNIPVTLGDAEVIAARGCKGGWVRRRRA